MKSDPPQPDEAFEKWATDVDAANYDAKYLFGARHGWNAALRFARQQPQKPQDELTEKELEAVAELGEIQGLSFMQVIKCAIRDYQIRVKGAPDFGPKLDPEIERAHNAATQTPLAPTSEDKKLLLVEAMERLRESNGALKVAYHHGMTKKLESLGEIIDKNNPVIDKLDAAIRSESR